MTTNTSTVKTWRERIGQHPDFPLHAPTDVERAMEAEIAELRMQATRPVIWYDGSQKIDEGKLYEDVRALAIFGASAKFGHFTTPLFAAPAMAQTQAALDVLAERRRQVEEEGWTAACDDEHAQGQLARAAACYAVPALVHELPWLWPWDRKWWKPTDRRRDLVKAAALLLSDIERIDRAAMSASQGKNGGAA